MNLKRLTSLLLTLVMVVSLLPMAAFATEAQPCLEGCVAAVCAEDCDGENHTDECVAAIHAEGCVNAAPKAEEKTEEPVSEPSSNEGIMLLADETGVVPPAEDNTGLVVKYRLTETIENVTTTTDWTAIENQNETVSDTSRYIILDYSKNTILEVEAFYNGVKLGKQTENVGIGETTQGHKNAYIYDGYGNRGDNGQGSTNWDAKFVDDSGRVTVKPGERNGSTYIQMDIYESESSEEPVYFKIGLTVLGYKKAPDPDTDIYKWYKNATIIPATDKNTLVEVCATAATSLDAIYQEKGFYISGGKVYLNAQGKAANLFDIEVDGKNYSVAFVKETTESAEMNARKITLTDAVPTTVANLGTGYKTVNFDNMDSQKWQADNSLEDGGFKLVKTGDTSYTYYPIYIVKADNNTLVDVDSSAQVKLLTGAVNLFKVERVNLTINGTTATAFRLKIVPPEGETVVPTLYANATMGLFVPGETTKEMKLSIYSLDKFAKDGLTGTYYKNIFWKYGVSEPVHDELDEKWDRPQTAVAIERTFDEINGTEPFTTVVLTRGSGTPLYVDNLLYDAIYADTFEVVTKTDSKLDIKFTSVDSMGENCIGVSIALKEGVDTTTDISEEFKIRFKATDTNLLNYDNYVYGSVLVCAAPKIVAQTATVSNVNELLDAYNSMETGTITLKGGTTYTFADTFVHSRNTINLVGEEGAEVVFNRPVGSTGPVITVSGNTKEGVIKKITVDGNNERIGVYGASTGAYITLEDVTVRDCTTGVVNETPVGDTVLTNCTFENNIVGVKSHMDAPDVFNSTFKLNDTAVYIESHTFSIPVIKNSIFIDNTLDLETESESTQVAFQQNYFGTTANGRKTIPDIEAVGEGNDKIVYYVPYYTTAEKTILATTTEGAQVEKISTFAARTTAKNLKYTLPVDLTINPASVMESGIFAEIAKTENYIDNVIVEIPVTSADGEVLWQFSNDALAAAKDFNPATDITNIAVGDNLTSSGATAVTSNKGNATVYHELSFAHHGKLPGQATVTVDGEYKDINETLYLYHIVDGKLELVEDGIVGIEVVGEGANKKLNYTVSIDGCSEYIISTMIVEDTTDDTTGGTTNGTTGSSSSSSSKKEETATPAPTATPAATKAPVAVKPTASPAANDFISAVEVEEKINNAEAEVVFDVSVKDIVSAKAFEILAENPEKSLVFETDEFKWTFAASDITDAKAIDSTFRPTISLTSPNTEEIKSVAGDVAEGFTHIYFEQHGKLPGKATVEVFVGKDMANATKHLYHFNPEKAGFEFIETITITADGWASFAITHCSDYILSDVLLDESIVIDVQAETQPEVPAETPAEQPAETASGIGVMQIIIVVAVVAAVVIIFIIKRKKSEE